MFSRQLLASSSGKHVHNVRSLMLTLFVIFIFTSCYSIYDNVDSYEKWASRIRERLSGKEGQYFVHSIDRNKIRDGFVKLSNETLMKQVEGRSERMVWLEGKTLHLYNMSNFLDAVDKNTMITSFREGIRCYSDNSFYRDGKKYENEIVFYGAIFTFFDSVIIHTLQSSNIKSNALYQKTIIDTGRRAFFSKYGGVGEKETKQEDF